MRLKFKFLLPRQWPWGIDYETYTRRFAFYPLPGIGVEIEFGQDAGALNEPTPLTWGDVYWHYGAYRPKVLQTFPWRTTNQTEEARWDVFMATYPKDKPYLRSLSSLTAWEAVELIECTTGRGAFMGDPEKLRKKFFETTGVKTTNLGAAMMTPQGLNYLLQRGFNVFEVDHLEAPAPTQEGEGL